MGEFTGLQECATCENFGKPAAAEIKGLDDKAQFFKIGQQSIVYCSSIFVDLEKNFSSRRAPELMLLFLVNMAFLSCNSGIIITGRMSFRQFGYSNCWKLEMIKSKIDSYDVKQQSYFIALVSNAGRINIPICVKLYFFYYHASQWQATLPVK